MAGQAFEGPRRPSRPRKWIRLALAAGLVGLLGLGALSLIPAFAIRRHFEEGKAGLERAQALLLEGNLKAAAAGFSDSRTSFERAVEQRGTILLRLEGLLPFVGRTPDALLSLAEIGRLVSAAGEEATAELAALPDGLASLGLQGGTIPVDTLRALQPAMHRVRLAVDAAKRAADRLPESWVLGPVAEARDLVREKLAKAVPLARSADALLRSLPSFAGSEEPKQYFVAIQNSSELRGTGGLIGNYSILTIDDGRISLGPFRDTQTLRNLPASSVPVPSREFADLYNTFGGGGFWLNINMTPDAPTAARLIESLYERVEGQRLDGTIFFDLRGLEEMLRSTGPVRIGPLRFTVDAGNVIQYVAAAGYLQSGISNPFSRAPALIADAIWEKFLTESDSEGALRLLIEMAAQGHLIVHAADPDLQTAFRSAGVAGEFGSRSGDFFGVVLSNAAANKVDFFLREDVRYEVSLGPDGTATAHATVQLVNDAPAGQEPNYLLGPSKAALDSNLRVVPGENRSWTSFYCTSRCRLISATEDGRPLVLGAYREKGLWLFANFINVLPETQRQIDLRTGVQGAWTGDRTGGIYRLRLQGQPLISPATATVVVRAPGGMDIVWATPGMRVEGSKAVWRGELGRVRDLEVRFTKPFMARIWTRVWQFLSKPAIRL
jgi:hypothetical protein